MRPYIVGEAMHRIKITRGISPKLGGMIAVNPSNPIDQWYVSPEQLSEEYLDEATLTKMEDLFAAPITTVSAEPKTKKQMDIDCVKTAKDNISDLKVFGNGDTFQLICKASSQSGGWMKSTKAMEIKGIGCLVQVSTQQGDNIAEAVEFISGVRILAINNDPLQGRKIVPFK